MSLPHSFSPPAGADLQALLPEVVTEVAEHGFFAWAEPCERRRFTELLSLEGGSAGAASRWLRARVRFHGVLSGTLDVLLPEALACELGVALTGASPTEGLTDQELGDVAGELANMLCGVLLTRADRNQPFELWPPQVTRTADVADLDTRADEDLLFSLNDHPVVVRCGVSGS